ncbi:MAG: YncE family protein [Gemmatimonadaceae bacterium]
MTSFYRRSKEYTVRFARQHALVVTAAAAFAAVLGCGSDTTAPTVTGFLAGTSSNHEIGLVLSSTGKALTMFQLGSPSTQQQIPFGSSSTITPVGFSVRGTRAAVPLGDAASVALVNLQTPAIQRYFTFASGNATGSVFSDDTTIFAANPTLNILGRMTVGQTADPITSTVTVAPQPTQVSFAGGRVLVTSTNLDANFQPIGNGIVTAIDPKTMLIVGTATMGGTDSGDAAVGPDGLLYVVNTGDYVGQGSLTILNPATMSVVTTVPNMGVGAGAISIDANGLAYISSFIVGTIVWDTKARTFVRGTSSPVCAKLADGSCRGAFAATASQSGDVYQAYFGSATQAPYVFVFKSGTFTLSDSVSVGIGPSAIAIRSF